MTSHFMPAVAQFMIVAPAKPYEFDLQNRANFEFYNPTGAPLELKASDKDRSVAPGKVLPIPQVSSFKVLRGSGAESDFAYLAYYADAVVGQFMILGVATANKFKFDLGRKANFEVYNPTAGDLGLDTTTGRKVVPPRKVLPIRQIEFIDVDQGTGGDFVFIVYDAGSGKLIDPNNEGKITNPQKA